MLCCSVQIYGFAYAHILSTTIHPDVRSEVLTGYWIQLGTLFFLEPEPEKACTPLINAILWFPRCKNEQFLPPQYLSDIFYLVVYSDRNKIQRKRLWVINMKGIYSWLPTKG